MEKQFPNLTTRGHSVDIAWINWGSKLNVFLIFYKWLIYQHNLIFLKLSSITNYKLQRPWPQGLFIALCPISRHQATNCPFEVIELLCKHFRTKKVISTQGQPSSWPPHLTHVTGSAQWLCYLVEIFHRGFSDLINELRLIPSPKRYSLQQPDRRQIVVAGLEFCSISHSTIRFSELRKPLNGPLQPIYSILSLVTPNVKSGVNTLAVNTVLPVMLFVQLMRIKVALLITYFMSFYWTHSSSTFSISSTKQGLIHK